MPQSLVLLLLICAVLLPVIGAIGLRVLRPRLGDRLLYGIAALIFGISIASVIVLARSDVATIRIAGLAILLPDDGLPEVSTQFLPASDAPVSDPATEATSEPLPTDQPENPIGPTEPAITPQPSIQPPTQPALTPIATIQPTVVPPTETAIPPTETAIPPTETPIPPTATGPRRYTIQSGDTLRAIAERYGVTVQAILEANRLTPAQADALRPGQELVIP